MRLALGTAQFGLDYGIANRQGKTPRDEAERIVEQARARGVDTLDTAIAYGDSEERLGEIGLHGWRVVSKLPALPEQTADIAGWTRAAVEQSLRRLRIPSLYALLLHRPEQLHGTNGDLIFRALERVKSAGLVAKVGVSVYEPAEFDSIVERYALDIVQAPFNVLDRRLIDSGWAARLHAQGVEVHARSVFLQGLLLMESVDRPQKFDRWRGTWNLWDESVRASRLTPLQACLRFALGVPYLDKVVVGVDTLEQLKEVLEAMGGPAPTLPEGLKVTDPHLLNPAHWNALS